jgi:hypothetical protein
MSEINEDRLNDMFNYVKSLPDGELVYYHDLDRIMGWESLDTENPSERARLNELRNQTKARINTIARKGVNEHNTQFDPFQLVIRTHGESWMKIADFSYVPSVFSNGSKRVTSAIANICNRSKWASDMLPMTSEQRMVVAMKVEDLRFREIQLRNELKYIASRISSLQSGQVNIAPFEEEDNAKIA